MPRQTLSFIYESDLFVITLRREIECPFQVEVPVRVERDRVVPSAILLLTMLLATGCGKPPAFAFPPPTVSVVQVRPERVSEPMEFAGQVQAVRRVEVRSAVAGVIVAQPIAEGAPVKAGQVLFQIDPTTYAAALRGAQARLAQAQAQLDNATRTVTRLRPLLAEHAVAQKDVDDAESAEAQARAATDDAKASVDRARKDLNDTNIKAEIAGRVGKANLVLGARVTGPADLLTTIDVLDPIRVTFRPSSQQVLAWRRDSAATRALSPGGNGARAHRHARQRRLSGSRQARLRRARR